MMLHVQYRASIASPNLTSENVGSGNSLTEENISDEEGQEKEKE